MFVNLLPLSAFKNFHVVSKTRFDVSFHYDVVDWNVFRFESVILNSILVARLKHRGVDL